MGCGKGPLLPRVNQALLRESYLSYWVDTDNYQYRPNVIVHADTTPIINTTRINGEMIDKDKVMHLTYTVGIHAPCCLYDVHHWLAGLHDRIVI